MREYHLVNENNVRFSLRDFQQKAFIPSLKGLGTKKNLTFVKVGNFYKTDHTENAQGTLSGTVVFNSYENYRALINFIENANALRLIYKPLDVEYFRDVSFSGLGDLSETGSVIELELSLFCNSLWYTANNTRFIIEEIDGQSQYPLLFGYTFNDYANFEIIVNNDGHAESELLVEFYGYILNPVIELWQEDTKIYTVSFDKEILVDEKLIYSSRDGNQYCLFESGGVQSNAVSAMRLDNDNFFKIPKGLSKLVVTSDTGVYTKIVFTIFTAYTGV